MVRSRVTVIAWILGVGLVIMPWPVQAETPVPTVESLPANGQSPPPVPMVEPLPPNGQSSPSAVPTPPVQIFPVTQPPTSFDLLAPPYSAPSDLNFDLPGSEDLRLPSLRPPLRVEELPPRLEIRLSQRRVLLFRGKVAIKSYAIAVGRPGWETPTGIFSVRQMFRNPVWVHPLKQGISIPGGDPENPLGLYWIGFWTDGKNWIGFHGTDNPKSVGTAASHGCIRMYNKDIEELFKKVSLGTEVKVVK